jgi:hypothetical protein
MKSLSGIVRQSDKQRADIKFTLDKLLHEKIVSELKVDTFLKTVGIIDSLANSNS